MRLLRGFLDDPSANPLSGWRVSTGGNARFLSSAHACARGFRWYSKATQPVYQ